MTVPTGVSAGIEFGTNDNSIYNETASDDLIIRTGAVEAIRIDDATQVVTLANALPADSGGTGQTIFAVGDILYADTTTTLTPLVVGSDTEVLTLSGGVPTWAAASGGGGGLTWSEITDATKTMVAGEGYVANRGTAITFTTPAVCAIGDIVAIANVGAGLPVLTAASGDTIKVVASTTSAGGTLTATEQYDAIEIICVTANTTWVARAMTGNWTIA
jgi:hypothetical protein